MLVVDTSLPRPASIHDCNAAFHRTKHYFRVIVISPLLVEHRANEELVQSRVEQDHRLILATGYPMIS